MAKGRFKDVNWDLSNENGRIATWENVQIAVLMDIRDELKRLNQLLHCSNFVAMPSRLTAVANAAERIEKRIAKNLPLRRGNKKP